MVESTVFEILRKGDFTAMKALLSSQPEIARVRDPQGVSILLHTLYQQQPEWAEELLARLEALGDELDLFEAAALGRVERVGELVGSDAGAVTREAGDGFTALHLAAFFSQPEIARLLLEEGAAVDAVAGNPIEVRPLHSAVAAGCLPIVSDLLERNAEVDSRQAGGFTPLMGAAAAGHEEIVRLLLDSGADPALESDQGQTAADLARDRGHEAVLVLLVARSRAASTTGTDRVRPIARCSNT